MSITEAEEPFESRQLSIQAEDLTPPELETLRRQELSSAGARAPTSERAMQRKMAALELELARYNLSKSDIWS